MTPVLSVSAPCRGARLKVQAKAKLDQISGSLAPRKSAVQVILVGDLEPLYEGAKTELGCYGLASVLKVSDDKIDYNRANYASFCCFQLL